MLAATTALLALAIAASGCASTGLNRARQVITTSLHVEADAETAVVAADKAEKDSLVAEVKAGKLTPAGADATNSAWEAKLARVKQGAETLKDGLVTASHVVDVVAAGGTGDYQSAITNVTAAFASLVQALSDLGVHLPGVN